MSAMSHVRSAVAAGAVAAAALAGCASTGPAGSGPGHPAPGATPSTSGWQRFSRPTEVTNAMFPLKPGTEFRYQGRVAEAGKSSPHSVTFTVTGLTKVVDGVRTVVAWDRDYQNGKMQEQELAFFAQDDRGNVWNFGEYPGGVQRPWPVHRRARYLDPRHRGRLRRPAHAGPARARG
jgi:hypothetical protein